MDELELAKSMIDNVRNGTLVDNGTRELEVIALVLVSIADSLKDIVSEMQNLKEVDDDEVFE
jgi:hypothetical protein